MSEALRGSVGPAKALHSAAPSTTQLSICLPPFSTTWTPGLSMTARSKVTSIISNHAPETPGSETKKGGTERYRKVSCRQNRARELYLFQRQGILQNQKVLTGKLGKVRSTITSAPHGTSPKLEQKQAAGTPWHLDHGPQSSRSLAAKVTPGAQSSPGQEEGSRHSGETSAAAAPWSPRSAKLSLLTSSSLFTGNAASAVKYLKAQFPVSSHKRLHHPILLTFCHSGIHVESNLLCF